MKNNEEGIQPIQPAVPTDNTEPAAPAEAPAIEPATEPTVINEEAAAEFASEETAVSDELLQELHELDSEPRPAAPKSDIVFTDAPKKSRVVTILFVILLLGAIAAAGVFAYLYFTKPTTKTTSNNTTDTSTNTSTTDTTPTTPTEPNTTPDDTKNTIEGTAITDNTIVDELTKKVAILLAIKEPDNDLTFASRGSIMTRDLEIIGNGDLEEGKRLSAVIDSLSDEYRTLTDQEVSAIEEEANISLILADKSALDADTVAEAYKKLFGKAPTHQDPTGVCSFSYSETLNLYYSSVLGCGGTSDYFRFYHVTDFTEDDNHAYVYIKTSSDKNGGNSYCDIDPDLFENETSTVLEPCGTNPTDFIPEGADFTNQRINFGRYRFVFNQADDGTYYFVEVEKL